MNTTHPLPTGEHQPHLRIQRAIHDDETLSTQQKALLLTDGTLTPLLEVFAGEPIRIRKITQRLVSRAPLILNAAPGQAILKRVALLCGARDAYIHAQSQIILDRLPIQIRDSLRDSDHPFGRLLTNARLELHRELIDFTQEPARTLAKYFGEASDSPLLKRTTLVRNGGQPIALITEAFPKLYFSLKCDEPKAGDFLF